MSDVSKGRLIANVAIFVIFIWLIIAFVSMICWLFSTDLSGCEKTGNQQSQAVVQYITVGKITTPIVTSVTYEEYICKGGERVWN